LRLSQEPGFGSMGASSRKSSQARLLCFVVTTIAKLATCHSELLPRAHVSLSKVLMSVTCIHHRVCAKGHYITA
jgi:AP-5 complex subunit zeta-1